MYFIIRHNLPAFALNIKKFCDYKPQNFFIMTMSRSYSITDISAFVSTSSADIIFTSRFIAR